MYVYWTVFTARKGSDMVPTHEVETIAALATRDDDLGLSTLGLAIVLNRYTVDMPPAAGGRGNFFVRRASHGKADSRGPVTPPFQIVAGRHDYLL